ncbi:hypothetical protein GCM10025867_24680 [Frondihabitans sucicola]|uniref:Lipoprotein n=1 Tax=Frondihabitans sucicola TaxID=1268041 RepID=A0ABN6XYV6_9MICO|nr:hypothetical protein [Frondihabitans sucicola]BDZ50227.1 hypothetical protein GCM10025867_24680 [Frondihabitans sucicola]
MKRLLVAVAVASCAFALTGCSTGYPDIAGVWKASDGTPNKTISDDGNCTSMLYRSGKFTAIAEPGMCHIIGTADGGGYTLQVTETGYSEKYTAKFTNDGKTIDLTQRGKKLVTLTKAPSVH